MAQELGTGYVTIMPSTKGLQSTIQSSLNDAFDGALSKGEGRFRSFFGKVAAAGAAVLATVGLGKLVKNTVELGVSYNALEQSSRAAFTTILGSGAAASDMMSKLDAFAQISPFDKAIFIQGTQQLLGFGVAADRVIPTLQAVQDAVAAVGGSSQDISQITYALAQIKGQGKLTGQTLNQLGQYGINAADIIAKQMGTTSDKIRDMASSPGGIPADKVFDLLVNGLEEKFSGAAANVKNTWVGILQAIGARIRNIGSDMVEPFVSKEGGGYAVIWAAKLGDALSAIRQTAGFKQLTAELAKFGATLTPIISKGLDRFIAYLSDPNAGKLFTTVIPHLIETVKTFSPLLMVINALKPLMGELKIAVKGAGGALHDAFVAVGPVMLRLLADMALVIADLAPVIGKVANIIAVVFADALSQLLPPMIHLVMAVLPMFVQMVEILLPALVPLLPVLLDLAHSALPILAQVLQVVADIGTGFLIPMLVELTSFLADNIPLVLAVVAAFVGWKAITAIVAGVNAVIAFTKGIMLAVTAASYGTAGASYAVGAAQKSAYVIAGLFNGTLLQQAAAMIVSKAQTVALAAMYAGGFVASVARATAALIANKAETVALAGMYAKDMVIGIAKSVAGVAVSTGAWIANTAAQLAAKAVILGGAIALGVATAAQWLFNAAMDANPIGLIILAIAALVAGIIWLATQTTFFQDAWKFMVDLISTAWNWLWTNVIKPVVDFIARGFQALGIAVGLIGKAFHDTFKAIGDFVSTIFRNVVNFVADGINTVIDLVNGAIGGINLLGKAASAVTGGAISWKIDKIPHVPKLGDSGTIKPRPGGTLALLAERGRAESVVDQGKLNDLMDAATNSAGGDRPIYTELGTLLGWIRTIANGEAQLVWATGDRSDEMTIVGGVR